MFYTMFLCRLWTNEIVDLVEMHSMKCGEACMKYKDGPQKVMKETVWHFGKYTMMSYFELVRGVIWI